MDSTQTTASEVDQLVSEWNAAHIDPRDAEIDRLRTENTRLLTVNSTQSGMLKQAVKASHEWMDEIDALRKAVDDLTAEKTALTEMIRGMMEANAENADSHTERLALHKLIGSALVNLDHQPRHECITRLLAMRREYAELCAEVNHV